MRAHLILTLLTLSLPCVAPLAGAPAKPAEKSAAAAPQKLTGEFKGTWKGRDDSNGDLKLKDRKSTRLNSSHVSESRMPSSA